MADEVLIAQGLKAREGLIGLVLEEALDRAVSQPSVISTRACGTWRNSGRPRLTQQPWPTLRLLFSGAGATTGPKYLQNTSHSRKAMAQGDNVWIWIAPLAAVVPLLALFNPATAADARMAAWTRFDHGVEASTDVIGTLSLSPVRHSEHAPH